MVTEIVRLSNSLSFNDFLFRLGVEAEEDYYKGWLCRIAALPWLYNIHELMDIEYILLLSRNIF